MERTKMKHTPHDIWHTCISLLTKADVNPTTIKKIVGHKEGAMSLTEKVYTHMDYQTLLDAIKKIPRSDIFRGFSVYKVVCPTHMIL